ncbi:hypothetical protein [Lyngbya confervoides]|uniref:Uncharacterized protein n=1 Tax=Lyngbya confervoides BDU141951 TaxID=1574623 RepID=A0ABD4T1W4_9CYAN|nr:hypothetical protein [Lyngbya confervoides]MCM1982330.1 hypothetical protein [Lyngbya confervoides BDU141951]
MKSVVTILPALLGILILPQAVKAQAHLLIPLAPAVPAEPAPRAVPNPAETVGTRPGQYSDNRLQPPASNVEALTAEKRFHHVGLVDSISGDYVTIHGEEGARTTHTFSPKLATIPQLSRGMLVSYNLTGNQISDLQVPVVKEVFEGVLIVVEEDVLGLVSAVGERKLTKLPREKIASLRLLPGQAVKVVEFEGTSMKVICSPGTHEAQPINLGVLTAPLQSY